MKLSTGDTMRVFIVSLFCKCYNKCISKGGEGYALYIYVYVALRNFDHEVSPHKSTVSVGQIVEFHEARIFSLWPSQLSPKIFIGFWGGVPEKCKSPIA